MSHCHIQVIEAYPWELNPATNTNTYLYENISQINEGILLEQVPHYLSQVLVQRSLSLFR